MSEENLNFERVAKIGGSSMAQPTITSENLIYPGNEAEVLVVSAPGINKELGHTTKLTDRLLAINGSSRPVKAEIESIQEQLGDIATLCDPQNTNNDIGRVVDSVPIDIDRWRRDHNPVAALGEYWMAQIFAAYTGREFIDARNIIRFDQQGNLSLDDTYACAQRELNAEGRYVIPGFYGADGLGKIHLLERGGSDITGAILANVLGADTYDVWSDVPGYMTANPNLVANARLVREITYREAREMYIGCELLHRDVLRLAGRTAIRMRNTFGEPSAVGTTIVQRRNTLDSPIVGIAGAEDLLNLDLHEFGMNEQAGMTNDAFDILADRGIPYEHTTTSTDDLSIIFRQEHRDKLPYKMRGLNRGSRQASVNPIGATRFVGETLGIPGSERTMLVARALMALATSGIDVSGISGAPDTVSRTFFLHNPEDIITAIDVLHQELIED